MKRRLYYYGEDVLSKSFLILPKELVFTKSLANMSAKSKILYCVLRERLMLSARNNWTDENGRIYIIYSIEKIAEDLFYSRATIMRMMDELEHLGLIERRKQGLGKPNLVYLCNSETIAELLSGADIEIEEWEQGETEHRLTCQICNPEHTAIEEVTETVETQEEPVILDVTCQICNPEESRIEQQEQIESEDRATDQQYQNWQSQNQNDPMTCQICNFQKYQDCNSNNTEYKKNNRYKHLSIMYTVNHSRVQDRWMDRDCVEAFFRKKWAAGRSRCRLVVSTACCSSGHVQPKEYHNSSIWETGIYNSRTAGTIFQTDHVTYPICVIFPGADYHPDPQYPSLSSDQSV